MIKFIISVTVVLTPLNVVWFAVCICCTSDPIHFLRCLAVDIQNQQLHHITLLSHMAQCETEGWNGANN